MLSKWLFKLINEEGMWQQLLRNKYLKYKPSLKWNTCLVILICGLS